MQNQALKLLKTISQNKKFLLGILGFSLFVFLLPLSAAAWDPFGIGQWVFDIVIGITIRIGAFFAGLSIFILAILFGLIYYIVAGLLTWSMQVCLRVSVMPADVKVLEVGWNATRDLANMFIILILVFIGLATILRMREYESKKLLPLLILVALLINFSPVIIGFIVDISNIFTNFFLSQANPWNFNVLDTMWDNAWVFFKMILGLWTEWGDFLATIGGVAAAFMYGITLLLFYIFASWVLFLINGLFLVRIIILWILVILSPVVFALYILPATRKYWKDWWQNLVQWSIIGIPIGFFLYLSSIILKNAPDLNNAFGASPFASSGAGGIKNLEGTSMPPGFQDTFAALLTNMLVPAISFIMLYIGYKLSRKNMPAFANSVIGSMEKGLKFIGTTAAVAATGGAAAGLAIKGLGGMTKVAAGMEKFAGKVPLAGKVLKHGAKPLKWASQGAESALTPRLIEYQEKTKRLPGKELDKIKNMSPAAAEAYINAKTKTLPRQMKEDRRLQYIAAMGENIEFTSFGGKDGEAAKLANKAIIKENPYLAKDASDVLKRTGGISEEAFIHSKLIGMPDKTPENRAARTEKTAEIQKEIDKTGKTIQDRLGNDALIIEAGLKLKYITKEEIGKDEVAALAEAKTKVTAEEMTKFLRDTAAGATLVKEFKPDDVKKIIDPDNLATRVGLTLGNPKNLQKIQDNFGSKKLKAIIEGRGGLNDATNTPEKLDKFVAEVNPQMGRALFTSPALRELDGAWQKNMKNKNGEPTKQFNDYMEGLDERRKQIITTKEKVEEGSAVTEKKRAKDFFKGKGTRGRKISDSEEKDLHGRKISDSGEKDPRGRKT